MKIKITFIATAATIVLLFTSARAVNQSIGYKDLSGMWQIKQHEKWPKHMGVDFISKYHEYSWSQIVDEKDSISRTVFGNYQIVKKDKEYIVSLTQKVSLDKRYSLPKVIRFFIRKDGDDRFSIQFLNEIPDKNEVWDSTNEEKTYSLLLLKRTNE